MPHVIVKLVAGRSEQQKSEIAAEITKAVMATAKCPEAAVSVAIEDVASDDWVDAVYRPDIQAHWDRVYKKPGYDPL
jgi:4-oxalocrotonate tautomerase